MSAKISEKFLACNASAGSGKTFTLAVRYVWLLLRGAAPEKILALTFTNKAAAEMKERVANILKYPSKHGGEIENLAALLGKTPQEVQDLCLEKTTAFLNAPSKIITIDKFFSIILRSFSLNVGLMPDYKISPSDGDEIFAIMLQTLKNKGLLDDFAFFAGELDMSARLLASLLEAAKDLVPPARPSAATSEQDVMDKLGEIQRLIAANPAATQTASGAFKAGSIGEFLEKTYITKETLDYKTFSKCYTKELDERFFELKAALRDHFRAKERVMLEKLAAFSAEYARAKETYNKSSDELHFQDVTDFVKKILTPQNKDFIYFRLDGKIEHILIDEFQDTSKEQLDILAPLIEEILSGDGAKYGRTFFIVGDPKQSIYRFRGADSALFLDTIEKYKLATLDLSVNYRSDRLIVDFVNEHFKDWPGYKPQSAASKDDGFVELRICPKDEKRAHLKGILSALLAQKIAPKEIGILVFNNNDAYEVAGLLREWFSGLPINTQSSKMLINQPQERALIEYIKYLYYGDELFLAEFNSGLDLELFAPAKVGVKNLLEKTPLEIAKEIIDGYKIFKYDEGMLEFLDQLRLYDDVFVFLEKIEKNETTVSSTDEDGINILTMYKSKGLQFSVCIVLDQTSGSRHDTSKLLLSGGEIFYKYKNREYFDEDYARAKERLAALKLSDAKNLEYVAFTRAKNALFILKNSEKSIFSPCAEIRAGKVEIQTAPAKKEQPKPSKMMKLGKQDDFLESKKDLEYSIENIYRGEAIHYTLEIMKDFSPASLDLALKSTHNHYANFIDTNEIRQTLSALISHAPFLDLARGKILKEQPVLIGKDLGVIDLMIEKEQEIIICDYKSGIHFDKHNEQIRNYMRALAGLRKDKKISGRLIYMQKNSIEIKEVDLES